MDLLREYLESERREILDNQVRLNAVGDLDRLPRFVRAPLESLRDASAPNQGMVLTLALSYGGQEELVAAAELLVQRARDGEARPGPDRPRHLCLRAVDRPAAAGGSGDPHQRRDPGEQLPPLAVRLRRVHLRRHAVARVPLSAVPGGGARVPAPGTAVRAHLGAASQVNDQNRNLLVRIVTAVVLLPLVLRCSVSAAGGARGWWRSPPACCALEYERITVRELGPGEWLAVAGARAMPARRGMATRLLRRGGLLDPRAVFSPPGGRRSSASRPDGPTRAAHVVTGCLYGGLGLAPVAALRVASRRAPVGHRRAGHHLGQRHLRLLRRALPRAAQDGARA